MDVIFLDFDGVLNTRRFRAAQSGMIDEKHMTFLRRIVDATGARVVLSTSWRIHWDVSPEKLSETGWEIDRIFGKYGIEIIGKISEGLDRAQEIRHWLDCHPDVGQYVILDDSPFGWGELAEHLVRTGGLQDGLDNRTAETDIAVINGRINSHT